MLFVFDPNFFFKRGYTPTNIYHTLDAIDTRCEISCQKTLLELCVIAKTSAKRRKLGLIEPEKTGYIAYGAKNKKVRRKTALQAAMHHKVRRMSRRWFKETEEGKCEHVDALYRVISANPGAFINLVQKA